MEVFVSQERKESQNIEMEWKTAREGKPATEEGIVAFIGYANRQQSFNRTQSAEDGMGGNPKIG